MDAESQNWVRRALVQRLESLQRAGVAQIGRREPVAWQSDEPAAAMETEAIATTPVATSPSIRPVAPAISDIALSFPQTRNVPPVAPLAAEVEDAAMARAKRPAAPTSLPIASVLNQPYPAGGPRTKGDKELEFAQLAEVVSRCTLCRELVASRRQTVFGVGNVNARVAFFGEAPGADEDRQGEPFVGRAGQLLTKIIEACGWRREDVYILNVLKCRPPDNRTPLPPEVDNCRQYFERQLEVIRPEYIVCVGAVPAQALLETTDAVGKLRGRFHRYRDSKVVVTYHPAYLLRNPAAKKFVWDDMQMLLKEMGLPIPGKKQQ